MTLIKRKLYKKIKKIVIRFLISFHKKLKLFKINSLYFYYLYIISNIYSINIYFNKINNNYQLNYLYIYYLKVTYYLKLFYKKIDLDLELSNLYNFFIFFENYNNYYDIMQFGNDFFSNNKDYLILNSSTYKLKINLWSFICYGKKIEYINLYYYNLYLSANVLSLKYPLINIILRFLLRRRLIKLIHSKKFKYSKLRLLEKYRLKEVLYLQKKDFNYILDFKICELFLNSKFIKLNKILSDKNLFISINFIWSEVSKINYLLNVFVINLKNDPDLCLDCEYNKFNILGLISLNWQLNRYGFKLKQRFYFFNLYKDLLYNSNLNNIILFNNYYLTSLIKKNNFVENLILYKLKDLIILIYIKKYFYKYIRFKKYIFKKKIMMDNLMKDWRSLIRSYSLRLFPINVFDYNNINLRNFLINSKNYIDNIYNFYLLSYDYKQYQKYSINFMHVIKNITINKKINSNYHLINNFFINLLFDKLMKYYYINNLSLLIGLKNLNNLIFLNFSTVNYLNLVLDKSYLLYKDNINKYYFFYLRAREKFFHFYDKYENLYLWDFEKSLLYTMYAKYMHHTVWIISRILFSIIKLHVNYFDSIQLNKKVSGANLRLSSSYRNSIKLSKYFYEKYKYYINRKDLRKKKKKNIYNGIIY